jgi:hypothetical protein
LAKFVEQHSSKTHFDASESAKTTFLCRHQSFDEKCLTLSKENQKIPHKHIRFGRSKSPLKGLTTIQQYMKKLGDRYFLFFFQI